MTTIDNPTEWLDQLELADGAHSTPGDGMCWMEAVAFAQGEDFTDHPDCVSPVIAAFGRSWQDALSGDDRQRLIKPLFWDVVGTRANDPAVESELAWLAVDWLVRIHTPAWLRLAGLTRQADMLAGLGEMTPDSVSSMMPTLEAVRRDARAAGAAAGAAARAAAWDGAWAAARAAAGAAAGAAAWDGAWDAAWDAAWAAAGDAAWAAAWAAAGAAARGAARDAARAAMRPTVLELQDSASDLVRHMCEHARTSHRDRSP